MRKKSHISLARYLVRNLDDGDLRKHKLSFYIGSILPDCKPSFLYKKHEITGTFPQVKREIERLSSDYQKKYKRQKSKYYRNLGQVTHYLADYFTFPHNTTFEGNLKDHCLYERDMKHELRARIQTEEAIEIFENQQKKQNQIHTAAQLFDYIEEMHRTYLQRRRNLADDCRWIMEMCSWALIGLVNIITDYKNTATAVVI